MTTAPLEQLMVDPTIIVANGASEIPTFLEVVYVVDLAGRFKGAKTFVEEASNALPRFYKNVGQSLVKWVAKAPKVKESEEIKDIIPGDNKDSIGLREGSVKKEFQDDGREILPIYGSSSSSSEN